MGSTAQTGNRRSTTENIYSNRYNETSRFGVEFVRMMLTWQGSVFKLIWFDLLVFIVIYFSLSLMYRFLFMDNPVMREGFEVICIYSSRFSKAIPVTFLTGFYVSNVLSRYWDQFLSLPWPDRLAYKLVGYIPGKTEYFRLVRRTVMRYINLSSLLVFRLVSGKVRQRFPTYKSIVDAGLMLPNEVPLLERIDDQTPHETTWAPVMWAINYLQQERTEGRIKVEAPIFANLIASFDYVESCNRRIFNHAWVNFPLAYTQVANLSVYAYLFSGVFAHQFLEPNTDDAKDLFPQLGVGHSSTEPFKMHTPVVYIPWFTFLEFIGYMGWVKVAETLLNPWGDDDEDFQINYLIDRNFQTSMMIVDDSPRVEEPVPDIYMSGCCQLPPELPYPEEDPEDSQASRHFSKSKAQLIRISRHLKLRRTKKRNSTTVSRLENVYIDDFLRREQSPLPDNLISTECQHNPN